MHIRKLGNGVHFSFVLWYQSPAGSPVIECYTQHRLFDRLFHHEQSGSIKARKYLGWNSPINGSNSRCLTISAKPRNLHTSVTGQLRGVLDVPRSRVQGFQCGTAILQNYEAPYSEKLLSNALNTWD